MIRRDEPDLIPHPAPERIAPPLPEGMTRLIPIGDWNLYHCWPPVGGLRHLVHYADKNGFDAVIRRIGRRILIDERAFFEWTKTAAGQPKKPRRQKVFTAAARREVEDSLDYLTSDRG